MTPGWLHWMLRGGLAVLYIATGIGKALDVPGFIDVIRTYELALPQGGLWVAALSTIALELALGAWMLSGRRLAGAVAASIALNVAYFALLTSALWRGLDIRNCGCFGVYFPSPLRWYTPLEDVVIAALSLLLLRTARR
jgi:hypothetical protein